MNELYKVDKQLNLPSIDQEVSAFWKKEKLFETITEQRQGAEIFSFYDGPPSANALPGIHHILSRTLKDIFCRYQTMLGKNVPRKAGWDTHGLPIELNVEKDLGISKEDIGKKITVEEYNKACRERVMTYTEKWRESTEMMGYWVDLDDPYITYENYYIETLWYLLKKLYNQNLLYKGYTIQPYSPAAGTGLSSHELNQPGAYRMVKDNTAVAMFEIKEDSKSALQSKLNITFKSPLYALAWTTTPWTLSSNTALAVGKKIEYSLVETFNPFTHDAVTVILAKNLIDKYFKKEAQELALEEYKAGDKLIPYKIIGSISGEQLLDTSYHQLLPYALPAENPDKAFRIIAGDFVSTEDGTGIVHIAPTFGADDMRVAKEAGVPAMLILDAESQKLVPLVDLRGRYRSEMHDDVFGFGGEYIKEEYLNEEQKNSELQKQKQNLTHIIKDTSKLNYLSVDERLILKLQVEGKLFKKEKYEHTYPHCWRTDKPILYYPLDSWFIKTSQFKDRMVALNKTIQWKPESTGTGRFGAWLENVNDWNLSRSRFWGTPLPIWRTEDGLEEVCIGEISELQDMMHEESELKEITDLHKPYIDKVILKSPSGKKMYREPDLIDVWFDSGAMPYAQNKDFIALDKKAMQEKKSLKQEGVLFPADFIAEGVDQTRGWFYTLHALSTMLYDSIAYKNVISNGHLVDKNGVKMSKRLGNVVDPFDTIYKYGADATRWYLINDSQPWDSLKFNIDGIVDVQRQLFGTLFNTYNFFALYANIDQFIFDKNNLSDYKNRSELDRWIISMLHSLSKSVAIDLDNYEPTRAVRAIESFVDDHLSNWYVRLSRRIFWKSEMNEEKKQAYETLYECLETLTKLMAPFAPFFSEWMYSRLNTSSKNNVGVCKSVHQCMFSDSDEKLIDIDLERRMQLAQSTCSLLLSLRKKSNIKVRQPLQKVFIPILNQEVKNDFDKIKSLILSEVNVKELIYITEEEGIIKKKIKPNFKTLGSKLGADMKGVAQRIQLMTEKEISEIEKQKKIELYVESIDKKFEISIEDVEISSEDIEGMLVANNSEVTVALDVTITPELKLEGDSRELVNRIQNLRKQNAFNVLDKIKIYVEKDSIIDDILSNNRQYICDETLATEIIIDEVVGNDFEEIEINDAKVKIKIVVNP